MLLSGFIHDAQSIQYAISLLFFFGTSCSVQQCLFTAVPLQRDSFAQQDLNLSLLCWLSLFEPRTVAGIPLQCSQQKYMVSWLLWQINSFLIDRMCLWSTLFFWISLKSTFTEWLLLPSTMQGATSTSVSEKQLQNETGTKFVRFWRWYGLKFVYSDVCGNRALCACLGSKCNKTQW